MPRNVPVSLANPNLAVANADQWVELNKLAGGNPEFTAVEIKAFYVVGLLDDICQSVDWLLRAPDAWPDKYLPAFSLFASGVDLLGRCLTGNMTDDHNENLKVGFHYLAKPNPEPPAKALSRAEAEATVVAPTNIHQYTVADLVALRHYTAHGQATTRGGLPGLHVELLDGFPKLIGKAMNTYWDGLQSHDEYCIRMANAKFEAYRERVEPLKDTLEYFSHPGNSIGGLFYKLDWQVYK